MSQAFRDRKKIEEQIKRIRKIRLEEVEAQISKAAYLEEKRRYNESVEGMRDVANRKILQSADKIVVRGDEKLIRVAEEMSRTIYDYIVEALSAGKTIKKQSFGEYVEISNYEIQNAIEVYLPAIKELKSLCEIKCVDEKTGGVKFNAYDQLFNKLVNFDIRFALFSDENIITKPSMETKIMTKSFMREFKAYKDMVEQDHSQVYVDRTEVADITEGRYTISRELIERSKQARKESSELYEEATEQLARDLFEFFKFEVQRNWGKKYSEKELLTIINNSRVVVAKIEELSKRVAKDYVRPSYELMDKLIELDSRFLILAPKRYLKRMDLDFSKLSNEAKNMVFKNIQKYKLMDDSSYFENYAPEFAEQIGCSVVQA